MYVDLGINTVFQYFHISVTFLLLTCYDMYRNVSVDLITILRWLFLSTYFWLLLFVWSIPYTNFFKWKRWEWIKPNSLTSNLPLTETDKPTITLSLFNVSAMTFRRGGFGHHIYADFCASSFAFALSSLAMRAIDFCPIIPPPQWRRSCNRAKYPN